jgi:hypothetical protein
MSDYDYREGCVKCGHRLDLHQVNQLGSMAPRIHYEIRCVGQHDNGHDECGCNAGFTKQVTVHVTIEEVV